MDLKTVYIESGPKTPQIDLNHLTGELIFSGKSILENPAKLYEGILEWIQTYILTPRQTTNLRLNIEYFNTASVIWLAKIVKALCGMKQPDNTLIIHLYFDIEEFDSMETEDLKEALSPVLDMVGIPTLSIGIKVYGTDENGNIIKESMVLV
ncbi:MAG TPA: SiaC family regulatory phosphoprotein [Bacteroidales bacterium]|nr:SiaC family regulatory phosphoprotein [Bacteroidales bacterium]HPI68137.1 SiaC family regulatory phosphoprotein [Bacteroidales bacterium]HPR72405.1 SiaC family regulatory phosphoprotein [Bacteroidales bacterium]